MSLTCCFTHRVIAGPPSKSHQAECRRTAPHMPGAPRGVASHLDAPKKGATWWDVSNNIWGFPYMGTPKWSVDHGNPIKTDDFRDSPFMETPIWNGHPSKHSIEISPKSGKIWDDPSGRSTVFQSNIGDGSRLMVSMGRQNLIFCSVLKHQGFFTILSHTQDRI